jgi:hypothetical protein
MSPRIASLLFSRRNKTVRSRPLAAEAAAGARWNRHVMNVVKRDEDDDNNRHRSRARRESSFSTTSMSSSPSFHDYNNSRTLQQQQRSFHSTTPNRIILPFVPEMILFVFVAGGWTAYRSYHGKPLTPDEALAAQEAYRKHEEKLKAKQATSSSTSSSMRKDHSNGDAWSGASVDGTTK